PEAPVVGARVSGVGAAERGGALVFHAGTAIRDGALVSAGGRVLAVTATGKTVDEARERAYAAVGEIEFPGACFRTDIGETVIRVA
ncbi:MAG: phosphoribosylamine--glycine ligase, partial [Actinomycetota bacterium]|nr:phosphoribosylamine--glycine ligase [Actinomycetota bacterium]